MIRDWQWGLRSVFSGKDSCEVASSVHNSACNYSAWFALPDELVLKQEFLLRRFADVYSLTSKVSNVE
jgi:hypothetical protein